MKTEIKRNAAKLERTAGAIRALCADVSPEMRASLLDAARKVDAARDALLGSSEVAAHWEARRDAAPAPFAAASLDSLYRAA